MNPTRIDARVFRAVALIGPDENRRAECNTAVRVALLMVDGSAKDLQLLFQRRSKPGKDAVDRLYKALRDPNLPDDLRSDDLIKRVNAARKTGKKRFYFKAQKKLVAAETAYGLLRQFNRKVSAEKGTAFCRLAALLYGEPRADLQWTCREVLLRARSAALSPENK